MNKAELISAMAEKTGCTKVQAKSALEAFMCTFLRIYRKDGGHTAGEEHTCQSYDEGLDLEVAYQKALYQAEGKTYADRQKYRNEDVSAFI